jgi:methylthioribose-1-phosphate isomerase
MAAVETLRWEAGALQLLDQRELPQRVVYVTCRNAVETAEAIRAMVVRGAPAIGCAAAYGIALAAAEAAAGNRPMHLREAFQALRQSRPTAVNLFWALQRMERVVQRQPAEEPAKALADRLLAEAHAIVREDVEANRALGARGAALLPARVTVMTHCNAGALATAGHGTALGIVRSARDAGKDIRVIANETRPYLQGARLTAWEMVREGISITLAADSAAGYLMQQGRVDAVIVGADRIAANGDVANKIGTYALAVLARRHRIPFYVAAPLSTIDAATSSGADIPIEERPGDEVLGFRELRWAPEGVAAVNPAFDVTPAELVSAIVTESGILEPPYSASIARMLRESQGGRG